MILTGLKNKEASINNLVSDQAKMIEQHLLKTRKNLVDKCVDTNFK